MTVVNNILRKFLRYKVTRNDLHISRFYSSLVAISEGKVIEVLGPVLQYCPLANYLYGNIRETKEPDLLAIKDKIRQSVEEKISEFGFFTERRVIYQNDISIPYGASEILMYAIRERLIEVAVTVCDGAGTVISAVPEIIQGIGARMNGLFYTTPLPTLVRRLEHSECRVIPDGNLKQINGVKRAIRLGYKKIAVTVNGCMDESLHEIRKLEKRHDVSIAILVVCTTGTDGKRIGEIKEYADLVWSCGSEGIRNIVGKKAILQLSVIIPVFVLTGKGINLVQGYFHATDALRKLDLNKQYVVSNKPQGEKVKIGKFESYLCQAELPVKSKKEPY